jgi:hypothetical protein
MTGAVFDPRSIRPLTMSWRINGDWNCGSLSIPSGTVLHGPCHMVTRELDGPIVWEGRTVTLPLPLNVIALDDDAATMMQVWHPSYLHHALLCAPGVKANLAALREAKADWAETCERMRLDAINEDLKARLK